MSRPPLNRPLLSRPLLSWRARRRVQVLLVQALVWLLAVFILLPVAWLLISSVTSNRELTVLLADALAARPEAESEVLWLRHAENLSFEGIGDRMGVSRKSIRGIWAC